MKYISVILITLSLSFGIHGKLMAIECPEENSISKEMVENLLTNPSLNNIRQEVGITNLDTSQILAVDVQSTCNNFDEEFGSFKNKYKINYYRVGDFYFVTQILKQPEKEDEVITGLSFIYIYDKNLNFIKGYSG